MKQHIQLNILALMTVGHFLEILASNRKVVCPVRPIFYLVDGLMLSCAFAAVLWIA